MLRPTSVGSHDSAPAPSAAMVRWWYDSLPRGSASQPYIESDGRVLTASELHREIQRGTELGRSFADWLKPYYERRPHTYHVLRGGEKIESSVPAVYAGYKIDRIYGRLDCWSGKRMKTANRVFFLTLQDARDAGFRACKHCKPDAGAFSKHEH